MDRSGQPPAPLDGIRVIEFCQVAAGPFCGMLLADLGADVVKVEGPAGDSLRQWPPLTGGDSENFASLNRNKRSIVLDLKQPDDCEVARALILSADIVIENNRPGVMDRLGLGYASLSRDKPDLIYCSISAFGQTGPRAKEGGFDLTMQGMAGVMSVTGEPGGAPVKCGVPISDFTAGLYAALSVTALLRQVAAGGGGGHVDMSMMGATLAVAALQTSEYFGSGRDPLPLGSAHPRNAPYQAFRACDGHFVMAAGNDKLWADVCDAIDRPDLADDPRFASTALRAANQTALRILLEDAFAARTKDDLIALFAGRGIPCGPINSYSAALSDPQVEYMGWVQPITLPSGATARTFGSPITVSGASLQIRRGPPGLGEHSAAIRDEIAAMSGRG